MKRAATLLFAMSLLLLPAIAGAQTCDGPTMSCALHQTNTQLTILPLPDPLPSMGVLVGAGTTLDVEPYGTTDVRCTDVNTDPSNAKLHSYEVTDTGGDWSWSWNANQTFLRVVEMTLGRTIVIPWNGTKCGPMVPSSYAPAGASWDQVNPNVDYYENGMTQIMTRTFDYTNPSKAPVATTLFDYNVVCTQLLTGLGVIKYNTQINTNDGDLFTMGFGVGTQGQDTAQYVISYQISADRCWLLNTLTGQVIRTGSPKPVVMGTVSTFFPFTIHSVALTPSKDGGPGWLNIGIGNCPTCPVPHGGFGWIPRTLTMNLATVPPNGGHGTYGYTFGVNFSAAPKLYGRKYLDITKTWYLSSNYGVKWPTPNESHLAWMNNDGTDKFPICTTQSSLNQPQPINISAPLMQELYCIDPNNGTFIRLTPTFVSGVGNANNFRTQQAIMTNGTQGFSAWSSDWEGTLGNADGVHAACTLGTTGATACRSDVFINIPWKLK